MCGVTGAALLNRFSRLLMVNDKIEGIAEETCNVRIKARNLSFA